MPINKQDATRALELLEQYHTQLNSTQDARLRAAIERVIKIFKSKLFNALIEIQEFYEVTLLDENKTPDQKALETQRVADRWAQRPSESQQPQQLAADHIDGKGNGHGGERSARPSKTSAPPTSASKSSKPSTQPLEAMSSTPQASGGPYELTLARPPQAGFGFSIAGGVDEPHRPGDFRLFVTKVTPGGAADADGRMLVGDLILAVNEADVTAVEHAAAVAALKAAGAELRLLMLRPPPPTSVSLSSSASAAAAAAAAAAATATTTAGNNSGALVDAPPANNPYAPLEIAISRPPGAGLGFSIAGGVDNEHLPGDTSIFVTRVIDGGAAAMDGRMAFGDRLLAVEGRSLGGCTHAAAVATLKQAASAAGSEQRAVRLTIAKATPEELATLHELEEAARMDEEAAAAAGPRAQHHTGSMGYTGNGGRGHHAGFAPAHASYDAQPADKKSKGLGGLFGGKKKK